MYSYGYEYRNYYRYCIYTSICTSMGTRVCNSIGTIINTRIGTKIDNRI